MSRSAASSSDTNSPEATDRAYDSRIDESEDHEDDVSSSRTAQLDDVPPQHEEADKKKGSLVGRLWAKTGLDVPTVLLMMKGGLPPTIALAMYQADDVANTYTTLGYLVAIVSILGFCILPRGKFIQTMVMNIIATCIGAGVCMLMVWSGTKARIHTTPVGSPPQAYNSSQSAVIGVWLFFQIWLVSSVKAKFPQFGFPTIIYAIFVNVAAGYGPTFTTTAQAQGFVQSLLETFLTGLALATVVSLFILPTSSRKVASMEIVGYISAVRGTLQAHKKYLQSLEKNDVFSQWKTRTMSGINKSKKPEKRPEIDALKRMTASFSQLHGKLHMDLPFAKREIAYGKLTPDDFESIFKHLREIMMPLVGLGSLMDLFDRAAERLNWVRHPETGLFDEEAEEPHEDAVNDWHHIMKSMHEPINNIVQAMDGGLSHVLLRLGFAKFPKNKGEEEKGDLTQPGSPGYVDYLEKQSKNFYNGKETTLRQWFEGKGIKVPEDIFDNCDSDMDALTAMRELRKEPTYVHQQSQRQLYLLLYVVYLLHSVSLAIVQFARFADEKDQAITKSKLILPGKKRFKKWVASTFKTHDADHDGDTILGGDSDDTRVFMGEAYSRKKDPEHLPPVNAWEKFGNHIRGISNFLRSPESTFGFRVACATMTIAITNFLQVSQSFFVTQRLIWALIMVSISMSPTSGQSVWAFFLRLFGTLCAMIAAWLVWYIPGQQTAGILVILWVFVSSSFYIIIKRPDLVIVGIIMIITTTLIIGYELGVRKLGKTSAESSGQPAYPIYILGPYRLACVAGGLAVAFFWTFFPFPISEHGAVRQKLGRALYLSANYYSVVHETVMARVRGDEGDPTDKTSPAFQLQKARNKVFAKQTVLLQGLRTHSSFVRWEFPIGGKFPIKQYDAIIELVQNIVNYTSLLSYASQTFSHPSFSPDATDPSQVQWFNDFRRILSSANFTSHEITSTLALISSSITNGQPLPPYLSAPPAYRLSKQMEVIDPDILSIRHMAEPGYAAFAVLQISTSCITTDLEKLLRQVKKLVGELDFSFHVVSTESWNTSMSTGRSSDSRHPLEERGMPKQD